MKIAATEIGGVRVLAVSGHIAAFEVDAFLAGLTGLRSPTGARVVLDLSGLDNLPTATVGGLIETVRALEASGGRLVLAAPKTGVRVTLDRLGVAPMVTIAPTQEEALETLRSPGTESGPS